MIGPLAPDLSAIVRTAGEATVYPPKAPPQAVVNAREYGRDEERENILRLLRRHECDALRSGNAFGERLGVVRELIAEIERGEHRR